MSYRNEDVPVEQAPEQTPTVPKPNQQPRQTIMSELPAGQPTKTGFITKVPNANGGTDYSCIIDYFVDDLAPFYPLLEVLYNATTKDSVTIRIYTYGGSVETGCNIMNAMRACKAKVTTIAYGICASIGAMIWCCGHERFVMDNATLMFHMPSGFCYGKTADNEEESRHIQNFFKQLMKKVTTGILTETQLDNIVNKRMDLFLPATVVNKLIGDIQGRPVEQPVEQTPPQEPIAPATPVPLATEGGN